MNFTDQFIQSCQSAKAGGVNTMASIIALVVISKSPDGVKLSTIADAAGVSSAGATTMADMFEKMGLAQRMEYPGDRRSYRLTITPKGRELLAKIIPQQTTPNV